MEGVKVDCLEGAPAGLPEEKLEGYEDAKEGYALKLNGGDA
jgi:hypothetical protein